jgi:hypothetical protein
MTPSTQDTTPRPTVRAEQRHARSTRRDDEQCRRLAGEAAGAPCWNPDDGDYA